VVWETTLKCNLRCQHCGSTAGAARQKELDHDEAMALCGDFARAGTGGVAFMGGEPFLRADWRELCTEIRALGMELSVITNGTCAGKEEAHFLAGLNPRAVAISLDAAKPELHDSIRGVSGAFKKALAFIEICRGENLPVSVITTVQKRNIGELAALRDLLLDKGLAWQIQTAGAEGGRFNRELLLTPEEFYAVGVFTASLRKNIPPKRLAAIGAHDLGYHSYLLPNLSLCDSWSGCQAGITVAGIRSDGGVYGCLAVNGGKCEGNVRERSFTDIWQDPSSFADTRGYTPDMLGENCRGCEFSATCKGGCGEMSKMLTDVTHNNPYCFLSIEKKLLADELKNPFRRRWLELRRKANEKIKFRRDLFAKFRGQK